jgi:hypothetical protein
MQRLEVSCAVRPIYGLLGAKGLILSSYLHLGLMQEVSLAGIPTITIHPFPFSPMNAKQITAVDT